jgi:hypothetical protein
MQNEPKDPTIVALQRAAQASAGQPELQHSDDGTHPSEPRAVDGGSAEALDEIDRPFDTAERARLFAGLRGRLDKQARRQRMGRLVRISVPFVAMAAAAAAMLFFLPHETSPASPCYYEKEQSRADEPLPPVRLATMDARFTRTLVLAPGVKADSGFEVRSLCTQGTRRLPCAVATDLSSANGDILIQGRRDELFPGESEGQWDLCIFIARRGAMPQDAELRSAGCQDPGARGYQALRLPIELGRPR